MQWSRAAYPWRTSGRLVTAATAAVLNLPAGPRPWFYRVRGLDETLPGTRIGMTWSDPVRLTVLPRTFTVTYTR